MIYTELTEKALRLAYAAHHGQVDRAGLPYIHHPMHRAEQMTTEDACVVALLHDTIEDTIVTAEYLRSEGFPDEIITGVLSVTKREGEAYDDFVRRAAENAIGREVKIADLEDNMDIRRLQKITEDDVTRLRKYLRAWQYLNNCGK